MHGSALALAEELELFWRLDAIDDHFQFRALAERDYRVADRARAGFGSL